jgi:hypothetical protein
MEGLEDSQESIRAKESPAKPLDSKALAAIIASRGRSGAEWQTQGTQDPAPRRISLPDAEPSPEEVGDLYP